MSTEQRETGRCHRAGSDGEGWGHEARNAGGFRKPDKAECLLEAGG